MNTFALINIARKDLGMEDDDYRMLLKRVTGRDSLRIMTEEQRKTVVAEMKRKGWRPKRKGEFIKKSSKPYVRLIHALWKSCYRRGAVRDGSRSALRVFVKRMSGVSDPEFLTYDQACPVIEALKAMEKRHG